ncbi:MAG: hypothetical protein RIF33_15660 [Cyclobacteriaceae bacterium]
MKLRISNQSLRLRINQDDLVQLTATGRLEEQFGNNAVGSWRYTLASHKSKQIEIKIGSNDITIFIPQANVAEWNDTDRVSFERSVSGLRILLEKDFQCLTDRPGENESLNFENPKSRH